MRFAWTAIFPSSRRRRRPLSQSYFFWSPNPECTFHSTDLPQLALFESFEKIGVAHIAGISQDHLEGDLPAKSLIDQL